MGVVAPNKRSWLVDLSGLSLFDTDYSPNNVTWLQALPLGTYQHPRYGELKITPDKVSNLAKSFKDNVREIDIDVDYDHKQHTGKAAGWVKDAEARTDGLWVAVQWTEDAYASLKKGEYKYFSSEFDDVWTHPKTKQKHQDVLFGGAITNRPFVKDILPINLTEVLSNEGGTVDEALRQLLRKKYQLAEDADDATILAAVALDEQDEPAEEESDEDESDEDESDEEETELSEDDDPRIVQLMEQNKAQAKRLMVLENATKLSETKRKLAEINSAGSKYAIPPKVLKELEPVLVKLSDKEQDAILKQFMVLKDNGLVELGERGGNDPDSQAGDESKRLWDKVEKLQKDNPKLSETDALMQVAETNPEMYEKYRSASYLKPKGE